MSELISRQKLIEELKNTSLDVELWTSMKPHEIVSATIEAYLNHTIEIIESQPPADQWIPCSDPRRPKNGQRVVVTTDLMKGINYINTAYYYTEKPKPWWEDEWDGEGFYQSHECGYCRREDVTAWFYVEPYKGVE